MAHPTIAANDDDMLDVAKRPPQENKSKVILAVDDDNETLSIIESIGRQAGYTMFVARSGEQCLSMLWRVMPQLILLDVKMPGFDGFEACRRIRSDPKVTQVPVLFLTARRTIEDLKRGVAVGGDDFLIKPFNAAQLLDRIEHLVLRGHLPKGTRARRSSKLGPPAEPDIAPAQNSSTPREARVVRMISTANGGSANPIEFEIDREVLPAPRAANAVAPKGARCSLRHVASLPLAPFLAPQGVHNAPGLISTSVLPLWWDALMAIAADQLTPIQADLDRLSPLDDAVGLDSLTQTLRGAVASLTARLSVAITDTGPSSPPAVAALARGAVVTELKAISEILMVAGPLDGALARFARAAQRDSGTMSASVADFSNNLVGEARKCYAALGDGSAAGRLFVLAVMNRLDKPWQIFRLVRALSWKRGAGIVARPDLAAIGDLFLFDLDGTAQAVETATAEIQRAASPVNAENLLTLVTRYVEADDGLLAEADLSFDSPWCASLLRSRAKMYTALDQDRLGRVGDAVLAPVPDPASSAVAGAAVVDDEAGSRQMTGVFAEAAAATRLLTYITQRGEKLGFAGAARRLLDRLREDVAGRVAMIIDRLVADPSIGRKKDGLDQVAKLVDILFSNDRRAAALGGKLKAVLKG